MTAKSLSPETLPLLGGLAAALAEPVSGVTVAGNLRAMFRAMMPASGLRLRRGTSSPTARVVGLTVAGG